MIDFYTWFTPNGRKVALMLEETGIEYTTFPININNKEIIGKDAELYFDKNTFGNNENDPRLFGRSLSDNSEETLVYKGIFTTCKYRDNDDCPPWTIKADQVRHNKNKKTTYTVDAL